MCCALPSSALAIPFRYTFSNIHLRRPCIAVSIPGLITLLYLGGVLGQLLINYELWMNSGGLTGQTTIGAVDWNPIVCLGSAFSISGLKSIGILLLTGVGITAYVRFHDKFSSKDYDERGFTRSKYGTYGTASWMKDKELKDIAEQQLFWVVGRNPFGQSMIYGEGSNYPQLYTALPGETVGEIPVGMQSYFNEDAPYWPQFNTATYKEVWGSSAARWLMLVSEF